MRTRFSLASQLFVTIIAFSLGGLGFSAGEAAPAFAEVSSGTGAISGGFFTDNAILPPPPGLPGLPAASVQNTPLGADSGLCQNAVTQASDGHQLPVGLLKAIAQVESGRLDPLTGTIKPWPWTIDANGIGYVYDSRQSAIQAAAGFEAAGITSLDIGCLQVNLAQHPDAFQTLAQAFDPLANATYAASFLTSLEQKFGNWAQAIAAYHSQTPALGQPYAAKVYAAWQSTPGAPSMAVAAVDNPFAMPANAIALQPAFALGASAPPMAILSRPDRAPTGRGLAAYRAAPILIATRLAPQG